jgi:hypothetical protein
MLFVLCPKNLEESYGSPWSFHMFLRYRRKAGTPQHRY